MSSFSNLILDTTHNSVLTDEGPSYFNEENLKELIEKGSNQVKERCLTYVILSILRGEKVNSTLLMSIVRFILPTQCHSLKRLLLVFWEVLPKNVPGNDTKMIPEMLLVCDALRKDLEHPNEFIRSFTLKLLVKIKNRELVESLIGPVKNCLKSRFPHNRVAAITAIFSIYKDFEQLIPDAPAFILNYLKTEQDPRCVRNAFFMLAQVDLNLSIQFILMLLNKDPGYFFSANCKPSFLVVIVRIVFKACMANVKFDLFKNMLISFCTKNSENINSAVKFEAAESLYELLINKRGGHVDYASVCVNTFVELFVKEYDFNIRLMLLNKIENLVVSERTLCGCVNLELLFSYFSNANSKISSDNIKVSEKVFNLGKIVLKQAKKNYLESFVSYFTKIVHKFCAEFDRKNVYCPVKVNNAPNKKVPESVVCTVSFISQSLEFLFCLLNISRSQDVLFELFGQCLHYSHANILLEMVFIDRNKILFEKIVENLDSFYILIKLDGEAPTSVEVIKTMALLFVVYCDDVNKILLFFEKIYNKSESEQTKVASSTKSSRIGADGSYITEYSTKQNVENTDMFDINETYHDYMANFEGLLNLFQLILIKCRKLGSRQQLVKLNVMMLCVAGRFVEQITLNMDLNLKETCFCIVKNAFNNLVNFSNNLETSPPQDISFDDELFKNYRNSKLKSLLETDVKEVKQKISSKKIQKMSVAFIPQKSTTNNNKFTFVNNKITNLTNELNKVQQLTGVSDPIYSEAIINFNKYEMSLDILVINQTKDTLQNLQIELVTKRDHNVSLKENAFQSNLKRSKPIVLGPLQYESVKFSIKVREANYLFGTLSYDCSGAQADRNSVMLECIHVDILDTMSSDGEFSIANDYDFVRTWQKAEWESQLEVNTKMLKGGCFGDRLAQMFKGRVVSRYDGDNKDTFCVYNIEIVNNYGDQALLNCVIDVSSDEKKKKLRVRGFVRARSSIEDFTTSIMEKVKSSV